MTKTLLPLIAALALSACMDSSVAVTQSDTLSLTCPSVHMKTMNNLPMRCGPQSVSPYTIQ